MKKAEGLIAAMAASFAIALTGCSVVTNADILYAINPPDHQLRLVYGDNAYTDGMTITMTKTYKNSGDKESFTLKNTSSSSSMEISSIAIDDTTRFALTGFTAGTTIPSASTSSFYIAFNDTATTTETKSATMVVSYKIDGRSRSETFTLKATREVDNSKPKISVTELSSGTALANDDANAFDFGTAASGTIDKTFILSNPGETDLTIASVTSDNSSAFTVQTNIQSAVVKAGGTTYVTIRRTDAAVASTATISVISNAVDYPTFKINVKSSSTTGSTPTAQISVLDSEGTAITNNDSTAYDFGYSSAGTIEKSFTVKNTGTAALTITSVISDNTTAFAVTAKPTTIDAGGTGTLTIQRTNSTVAATAAVMIISNASNIAAFSINVKSQDIPLGSLTVLDYDSNAISGSNYLDLGLTASRTFTIRNDGTGSLTLYSVTSSNSGSIAVSSAPTGGTAVSANGTATFTLTQASTATATTATITVSGNTSGGNVVKVFTVAAGGTTINATTANTYSRMNSGGTDSTGYDFGYAASSATKTISLTNNGSAAIVIPATGHSVTGAAFMDTTSYPLTIPAGGTGSLSLTYSPSGTDTGTYSATDAFGRSYALELTGTAYQQPNNVATPTLWLRADRITSANIVTDTGKYRLSLWTDSSGNGNNAEAVINSGSTLRPEFVLSGINGLPALKFSGNTNTDELKAYKNGGIISTSSGTTTFVVLKTDSLDTTGRYVLHSLYNGATTALPTLLEEPRYIDTVDGYWNNSATGTTSNKNYLVYPFEMYASAAGYTGANNRWAIDDDWATPTTLSNTAYGITMRLGTSGASLPAAPSPTLQSLFMWINGTQRNIGYLYSQTNTTKVTATVGSTTYYLGAFGQPFGNGYGSLATSNSDDAAKYFQATVASTPANAGYFYNWADTTYNTTIDTIYIGATNAKANNFKGYIAEIIIFSKPLSNDEVTTVNAYLKNKYGY